MDELIKVEYPESPVRCQWIIGGQQCSFTRVDGSNYCPLHDGNRTARLQKKESLNNYRLGKWKQRVDEFVGSTGIKSLREEIGIIRMTLEHIINKCETPADLIINSQKITFMVDKIEKLVSSANRLESSLGMLLDKQQVIQLAMEISQTISTYIKDEELLSAISDKIADSIERIGSPVLNDN